MTITDIVIKFTARNVILIVLASVLAAVLFRRLGHKPFTLTGYIPPGIPKFAAPKFILVVGSRQGNETFGDSEDEEKVYTFSNMMSASIFSSLRNLWVKLLIDGLDFK